MYIFLLLLSIPPTPLPHTLFFLQPVYSTHPPLKTKTKEKEKNISQISKQEFPAVYLDSFVERLPKFLPEWQKKIKFMFVRCLR